MVQESALQTRGLSYAYTEGGLVEQVTDGTGRITSYEYDAADRLASMTLPGGRTVASSYDAAGSRTSITPPGRPAHTFAYNKTGLLETITREGVGDLKQYSYDGTTGYLSSITTSDGVIQTYVFDGSLLSSIATSGEISGSVAYHYNSDMRVSEIDVAGISAAVVYTYDNDGLITGVGIVGNILPPGPEDVTVIPIVEYGSAAFTSAVTTTDSPSLGDAFPFPEHTGGYINGALDAIPDILFNENNTGEPYMLD